MRLAVNPYTCEIVQGSPASLCLLQPAREEDSCSYRTQFHQGFNEVWDGEITVQLFPNNYIEVSGSDPVVGRQFVCEGGVSHAHGVTKTWRCEACTLSGTDCVSCDVQQDAYCDP